MPHTNRKRKSSEAKPQTSHQSQSKSKKFTHSKREYRDIGDGWTQVADRGWKKIVSKPESCGAAPSPLVDMTLEEMQEEHERHRKQWKGNDACAKLEALLAAIDENEKGAIANAVCLGLGSLQAESLEWRRASHTQLAALETIENALRESGGLFGKTAMQDPRFTSLDQIFLMAKGYDVFDDPHAFGYINDTSLVFAIHCPNDLFSKFKRKAYPAVLIANDFRNSMFKVLEMPPDGHNDCPAEKLQEHFEESAQDLEDLTEKREDGARCIEVTLEPIIKHCEEIAFPQVRHDFSDTIIYWRHSKELKDHQSKDS